MSLDLKIYKLHNDVVIPSFATRGSACFDIAAHLVQGSEVKAYSYTYYVLNDESFTLPVEKDGIVIRSQTRALIPTGMIFDIPEGHSVRIHPRSSLAWKKGLIVPNSQGIIDSDYVHQVYVMVANISNRAIRINNGDRIAQAELVEQLRYSITETSDAPVQKTDRIGGVGSTGV